MNWLDPELPLSGKLEANTDRLVLAAMYSYTLRPQAAGRSITTNNQPRQSGADIVAIALSFFKLSQSESGDAETKKREGGGLRRSR